MSHYEPGDYKARIVRQGFSESKKKSTPFFFIEIEPTEALGANNLPDKIYRRSIDMYCTDKTMEFVIKALRFLGWEGSKLAELDPSHPQHHSFVDQEIEVKCEIEDGYDRFQLKDTGGGGNGPDAVPGIASKLDKLFGKQLVAAAPGGKRKAPAPAPTPPPIPDDEIPF